MNTFYKLPYKNHIEPKRKSDLLIAYEIHPDKKKPLYAVYITKEKLDDDEEPTPLTTDDDKNQFTPIPIIKHNELNAISYFIAGTSGSGKSYYTAKLVNNILTQPRFENGHIFLISGQTKPDPAYEDNIKSYFKLDMEHEDFYSLTYNDFENCIVIFDDTTSLGNRGREQFVFNLQKSLSENARKNNIALINISHQSRDFVKTKYIIHEATNYVLFPSSSWNDSRKFLKSYMDYDEDELKEVKKLSRHTRGICIHKSNPQYILSDHLIKFV